MVVGDKSDRKVRNISCIAPALSAISFRKRFRLWSTDKDQGLKKEEECMEEIAVHSILHS